jgi:hypothetical protein
MLGTPRTIGGGSLKNPPEPENMARLHNPTRVIRAIRRRAAAAVYRGAWKAILARQSADASVHRNAWKTQLARRLADELASHRTDEERAQGEIVVSVW